MDHRKPTGPKGSMAGPMQVSTSEKSRTGLNREIQTKIGQQLRAVYNDVVNQGVPDRFVDLIRRLDGELAKEEQGDRESQE
jgi:hypothetical protein